MLMSKDICCINFKGLMAYLEKTYGRDGVDAVIAGLVDNPRFLIRDKYDPAQITPVQLAHIIDSAYWVSNEFSMILLGNVNKVVEGQNPLMIAGAGAVRESFSKSALFAGRVLGPVFFSRQAARLNARFNRTKVVRLKESARRHVVLELCYRPDYAVSKDVCNWNLGIYTGLARLTGVNHVQGKEIRCVLSGDPCCEFRLSWKPSNWVKRVVKGLLIRMVQADILEMTNEHRATLMERDRLINRLAFSEKKYRTLFEDSMEAMNLTHNGRIQDVNPAWLKLHGFESKADVYDKNVIDFIHPDDRGVLSERRRHWPDNPSRIFRVRDLCRDGSLVEVEVYSSRIVIDRKQMILTTIRDVTAVRRAERERAQLEARLQRAERMEAIGTLAGGVAHDLNNILSGIVSYPELLLYQLPPESPLRRPIEIIFQSGNKATAIVQDLLTMARRAVVANEAVDLNEVVRNFIGSPEFEKLTSFHPQARVITVLADDLRCIQGSAVHLSKVVMNLVANAAEAITAAGEVRIATENCCLTQTLKGYEEIAPGDYVKLTVADMGSGISSGQIHRIFEPFYTNKMMGRSGTGLGMSVVWGTVKDHKGFIDVASAVGQGTTFSIYFPAIDQVPGKVSGDLALDSFKGRGETILLVDDNKNQRAIAGEILAALGYRVATVDCGEAAVLYLQRQSVDLVILDMIMDPGIDGLTTFEQIIAYNPNQRVIIASGYSETDRLREALRLGVIANIRKPYSLQTIARAVYQALNGDSVI